MFGDQRLAFSQVQCQLAPEVPIPHDVITGVAEQPSPRFAGSRLTLGLEHPFAFPPALPSVQLIISIEPLRSRKPWA